MTRDRLIHIHAADSAPCVACDVADTDDTDFTTDPGYWNTLNRRCRPSTIISPSFEITGRADPRTSALKGERKDQRKGSDPR